MKVFIGTGWGEILYRLNFGWVHGPTTYTKCPRNFILDLSKLHFLNLRVITSWEIFQRLFLNYHGDFEKI